MSTLARTHAAQIQQGLAGALPPRRLQALLSLRGEAAARVAPTLRLVDLGSLFGREPLSLHHLTALQALQQGDIPAAFRAQLQATSTLCAMLKDSEGNRLLPALQALTRDLRLLAVQVDLQAQAQQDAEGGGGEAAAMAANSEAKSALTQAMAELTNCFRAIANDRNTDLSQTKKLGMLALVNHLYCIAFRTNNFAFLKPLTRTIEAEQSLTNHYALADRVTNQYYMGRKAMYDADYKSVGGALDVVFRLLGSQPLLKSLFFDSCRSANDHLSFALTNCHRSSLRNKRLILIHLVSVSSETLLLTPFIFFGAMRFYAWRFDCLSLLRHCRRYPSTCCRAGFPSRSFYGDTVWSSSKACLKQ